jgi:two-component system, NtrC family, sensor kinase
VTDAGTNQELQRKAAEVEVLRHASLAINTTLDLSAIFDIVLQTMDELFDFHHSVILLLQDAATLHVVASRGYQGHALGGTVAVGTGVIGIVAKRRRLMRVNNLGQQRAYASTIRDRMTEAGRAGELGEIVPVPGLPDAERQIAIPLQVGETLIGVLSVESPVPGPFSEHDEVLVTIVANQAASAIQNGQLFLAADLRRQELAEAHAGLQQLNETLEDRVRERTAELLRANHELQETQAQLVQADRMASLGMLAAGVAHEINTPLGTISANADIVSRAVKVIREQIQESSAAAALVERPRLQKAFGIVEDTDTATRAATARVTTIVQSLRNFARLDEAELLSVDLTEGIDSALTLLDHRLKDRIVVTREYGELPHVLCYASQMNQAFMNLLTNAIEAIDGTGEITVITRIEPPHAVVEVSDTGSGIPPEKLDHIFDPGSTTKGVGVGVGVGLSITYRIVQDHQGSIEVCSRLGEGTTFTIRIPTDRRPQ